MTGINGCHVATNPSRMNSARRPYRTPLLYPGSGWQISAAMRRTAVERDQTTAEKPGARLALAVWAMVSWAVRGAQGGTHGPQDPCVQGISIGCSYQTLPRQSQSLEMVQTRPIEPCLRLCCCQQSPAPLPPVSLSGS